MNIQNVNKYLLIVSAVIIVVIIVFVLYLFPRGYYKQSPSQAGESIQTTTQSIIQSGNAAQCASVNVIADGVNYETVCKNNIAWNTAQANLDINACNGLDNQLMSVADCQNSVIAGLINKEGNIAVCNHLPTH